MEPLSIRVRLTLAYTAAFGILLGILAVSVYRTATTRLSSQADAQLEEAAASIRPLFNVSQSQVTWFVDKKVLDQSSYLVAHAIFDEQGQYLDGSALASVYNFGFTDPARQAIQNRRPTWETVASQGGHKIRALNSTITGSDGRAYLLRVGMLLDQSEEDLRQLSASLATLLPLVLLIGAVAGWWLAGGALEPVAEITNTAARISASNLAQRLPLRGTNDELDRLSTQLNGMIARLQGSFEQMSQFLSNVSHELRTPLAALRGSCEISLRSAKSGEEYRAVLTSNIEELDRLARTVSDLLALARAEAGQMVLNRRQENLTELLRDAVESTRVLAAERGVRMDYRADGEVTAAVDPAHLLRLLINLLDNAIKYNHANGRVEVELKADNGWAVVSISDTGRGIAAQDLPRIFDRFYRGEMESAGSVGGAGLGLSLARWVAKAHGGRIEVESQQGQGSRFRVWLPTTPVAEEEEIGQGLPALLDRIEGTSRNESEVSIQSASQLLPGEVRTSERSTAMQENLARWSYWLGLACGVVALAWRGLVAIGVPERVDYGGLGVGYPGFLNGAILFLLVSAASSGYVWVQRNKG